jgi:hypothetical protein
MKDHFPLALAPEEPHGQTAPEFAAFSFVADGAIEAQA